MTSQANKGSGEADLATVLTIDDALAQTA